MSEYNNSAVIIGCHGAELSKDEINLFEDTRPWGYILFSRNLHSRQQIIELTEEMKRISGPSTPILIDQEGGDISRLKPPLSHAWCNVTDMSLADLPEDEILRALEIRYHWISLDMNTLGINTNCTPLLDIPSENGDMDSVLKGRILGFSPDEVAERAISVMNGSSKGGSLSVIKHIPGHGRCVGDPHSGDSIVTATIDELLSRDFKAIRYFIDKTSPNIMAMLSHVLYKDIDKENCATQSEIIINNYIRSEVLGLDEALLITDDICMDALKGNHAERSSRCLEAGCDIILHCNGNIYDAECVMNTVPKLAGKSLERSIAVLSTKKSPCELDKLYAMEFLKKINFMPYI